MSTTTAIEVEGLTRSYGTMRAVDDVSFTVAPGECFAILGPNGAGKTTTVEILEGFRHRDAGRVRVLGVDPAERSAAWLARIGIVLQQATDAAELTVTETLKYFSYSYPRPWKVDDLIEAVGLTEKASTRTRHLSGGQRRRLDVALGIIGHPDILFLDEPTTGFDPEARRQFWTLIESLKEAGTTIVLTTHYLDEAEHLADRVAIIQHGRVSAMGPVASLGGRDRAAARVQWRDQTGELHEVVSTTPTEVLRDLLSEYPHGEVPSLSITPPSLEEIYLRMISEATPS